MKRLAAVFLTTFALALVGASATSAADDGSYGPWEPTYQGPITAPAGVVCPFTVTQLSPCARTSVCGTTTTRLGASTATRRPGS